MSKSNITSLMEEKYGVRVGGEEDNLQLTVVKKKRAIIHYS